MGIKDRKERSREAMKKLILDTSIKLFISEGYDKVSMRKIAEKMEYSAGTIYLYFKNKDEILYELHNIAFDKFYQEQLLVKDVKDPFEKLKLHSKIYINFALKNPEYYELMFIMRATGTQISDKKDWFEGMRTFEFLKQNMKECIDAGYFKGKDELSASVSMWSLVHGIASLYLRNRFIMIPEEHLNNIIESSLEFVFQNLNQKE